MVHVLRRMYCFQESEPDSRPPPVCFSPPKAPPISAPLVGMLMLTMPQSDPFGPSHYLQEKILFVISPHRLSVVIAKVAQVTLNIWPRFCVNKLEERP